MIFLKRALAVSLWLLPAVACAQLDINTGVHSDVPTILQGFENVLLSWSGLIATAIFLLGAFLMVGSGGDEAYLSAGKKLMKAALIGLAIVLASWMILSTVISFIS